MKIKAGFSFFFPLFLLFGFVPFVIGQSDQAHLIGTLTDQSGAALREVRVTAETDAGVQREILVHRRVGVEPDGSEPMSARRRDGAVDQLAPEPQALARRIEPIPLTRRPLTEAESALSSLQHGRVTGRVVLVP